MGNSNTIVSWNEENHSYRAKISPRGEIVSEINVYPHRVAAFPEGRMVKKFSKHFLEIQT